MGDEDRRVLEQVDSLIEEARLKRSVLSASFFVLTLLHDRLRAELGARSPKP